MLDGCFFLQRRLAALMFPLHTPKKTLNKDSVFFLLNLLDNWKCKSKSKSKDFSVEV